MLNRFRLSSAGLALAFLSALLTVSAEEVQAKIYKWKDASGKTHYTDNPAKIPREYRQNQNLETIKEAPPDPDPEPGEAVSQPRYSGRKKEHVIPIKGTVGGNYVLEVILNRNTRVNLLLDTGASMIVLSERVAKLLHLRNLDHGPQLTFTTAGGEIESPLIILNRVEVGSASARDVEATVNKHMGDSDGLLGMSFLGDYKMEVRGATKELVLRPLHQPGDELWGGQSADWWKSRFDQYAGQVRKLKRGEAYLKDQPAEARKIRKLIKHYQKLFDALEDRADRAAVPKKFRSYP